MLKNKLIEKLISNKTKYIFQIECEIHQLSSILPCLTTGVFKEVRDDSRL
jgi:hypothetical protein